MHTGVKHVEKGGKRRDDAPPNSNINTKYTKIDEDISFVDKDEFLSDKLHVPTSKCIGPKTSNHNLDNNEPLDETDRIARDHDRHYTKGGNRAEADAEFIGEQFARGDNPWSGTLGILGIAAAQLGRRFGIDLTEVATNCKKEFTHSAQKVGYKNYLPKTSQNKDEKSRAGYLVMRKVNDYLYS